MSWQAGLYVAAILLPLVSSAVILLAGRRLRAASAWVATGSIAGSFGLSLIGAVAYCGQVQGVFGVEPKGSEPLTWSASMAWASAGGLSLPIGVAVDNLAALMFLMVTFVATVVHIFAIAYMRGDARFGRFFATLGLFCSAMLGLVASPNLFQVFVFWELVGFCSYLLIGFWREDGANAEAADKAFLANRVGDVGMLVALGLIWSSLGTLDIAELNRSIRDSSGELNVSEVDGRRVVTLAADLPGQGPRRIGYGLLVAAGLGLFAGCAGKSAQFPLHVWLPDAMAGPTPVSALIHAATMVAAGVYLIARVMPILAPEVLLTIAYAGGITLFLGATIAMVQHDFKKVLAYSTVSQLGFMMLALGVGGRSAGLFHLLTHACFKALLFLGAGSVYHSVHTYEMARLGGLYRRMRTTALAMLAGTMAISGVPLFSGFYSKDAVLASALHYVIARPEHILLFLLPVGGAMLTAFYMFRLWFLIFAGEPRSPVASRAREGERLLTWPLTALAVPTVAVGWPLAIVPFLGSEPILERMLRYGEPIESLDVGDARWWALGASILVASIGFGLGALCYGPWTGWRRLDPGRTARRFAPVHEFLVRKFYLDELYRAAIVGPTLALARVLAWFDRRGVDTLVDGSAHFVQRLSRYEAAFDRAAIDRAVGLVAAAVYGIGGQARRLQTGSLRGYLMALAVAVVGLVAAMFAWSWAGFRVL